MINEALTGIKEAEDKAEQLINEGKLTAKEVVKNSKIIAVEEYRKIIEEANLEGKAIIDKCVKNAELQAKSLRDMAEKNIKEIQMVSEDKISSAVNIVIERIVNFNGNCKNEKI